MVFALQNTEAKAAAEIIEAVVQNARLSADVHSVPEVVTTQQGSTNNDVD